MLELTFLFIDEAFKSYLETLVTRLEGLVQAKSFSALTVYTWVSLEISP
jgi:hypothetical protein